MNCSVTVQVPHGEFNYQLVEISGKSLDVVTKTICMIYGIVYYGIKNYPIPFPFGAGSGTSVKFPKNKLEGIQSTISRGIEIGF